MQNETHSRIGKRYNPHDVFPDLGFSTKVLEISVELENVSNDTPLGRDILSMLHDHKTKDCIKYIAAAYQQDPETIAAIVGDKTIKNIMLVVDGL